MQNISADKIDSMSVLFWTEIKRKDLKKGFLLTCLSTFPRQWRTCTMSFAKREQRPRWMITPPNHTLTVTRSWPQLTPWPLNSLTSHWLALNRASPKGFYDGEREDMQLHCNIVAFDNAAILKRSAVKRHTTSRRFVLLTQEASRGARMEQMRDPCCCFSLFPNSPTFTSSLFLHNYVLTKVIICFPLMLSRKLLSVGDRNAEFTAEHSSDALTRPH